MSDPMKTLLPELKQSLDAFLASKSSFRIIKTIPGSKAPSEISPRTSTLFILDSSFNPPSRAHLSLATSALAASSTKYPKPHRLLLLFSAHNADKAPSPAAFEHRLAMMKLLAEDLWQRLSPPRGNNAKENVSGSDEARGEGEGVSTSPLDNDVAPIDVGVTTQPFYNDKSAAIEKSGVYPGPCRHIHLVGFDTFVRILDPKYYKGYSPPLSALDGYFERHGFRITMRPDDEWGNEESQQEVWHKLARGDLKEEGGRPEWADRIDMAQQEEEGAQVSSTRIRKAVNDDNWDEVGKLCTPRVTEWVKNEGLYKE